ncbi:MAG: flagellar brake protein [Actinobacteria bacterium]|nr:flagellar brake protein [Actinomycetota bacterium]
MDLNSREILHPKTEITIHTPPQPAFVATISEVEENIFWINLPRDGRQILVLMENQRIMVGLSLKKGLYEAETTVVAVGRENNRFYGLAIPEKFVMSKERQFVRVDYPITVVLKAGELTANSTMVNFSAGGAMVYLVKDLEKILESGREISIHLKIENKSFAVSARPAWKKVYDSIPFAGFEFIDIPKDLQEALDNLAVDYNGI